MTLPVPCLLPRWRALVEGGVLGSSDRNARCFVHHICVHPRTDALWLYLRVNADSEALLIPSGIRCSARVDGRSWQESKNQMTSDGNSRPVRGHLACSNKQTIPALFLIPHPRHPGSASLPSRPKSWTAAWFKARSAPRMPP